MKDVKINVASYSLIIKKGSTKIEIYTDSIQATNETLGYLVKQMLDEEEEA